MEDEKYIQIQKGKNIYSQETDVELSGLVYMKWKFFCICSKCKALTVAVIRKHRGRKAGERNTKELDLNI